MLKNRLLVIVGTSLCLAVGAGNAVAGGPPKKPPTASGATLAISPSQVDSASTTTLAFTLNVGSTSVSNGAVEIDAPAGWTFGTDAAVDGSSGCDVSSAVATSGGQVVNVSGVNCSTSQTIVVDVSATAPAVDVETAYQFGSSIKSAPGSRKATSNVYLTAKATELVEPPACEFC
jgi:hypothetical protein